VVGPIYFFKVGYGMANFIVVSGHLTSG